MLHVSETFHSVQGEGIWAGTPMHFVRLAGCNVGRHPSQVEWEIGKDRNFPILKTGHPAYVCHTYDNRPFWCDTDFQTSTVVSVLNILNDTWERHLCITGGEPALHMATIMHMVNLIDTGDPDTDLKIHLETSGTVSLDPEFKGWITCSPKQGFLPATVRDADEVKVLVGKDFDFAKVPSCILNHRLVFIQPVNLETSLDLDNLKLCMDILHIMPHWRLSAQLHKLLGWR